MQTDANIKVHSDMTLFLARCSAVWLATTGTSLAVGRWAAADLSLASSFDQLLPAVAALLLLACASWAWTVTTIVVVSAAFAQDRGTTHGVRVAPPWAQRLVLGACGIALMGAAQVPAQASAGHTAAADEGARHDASAHALAGLPLPDRTTGRRIGRTTARPTRKTRAAFLDLDLDLDLGRGAATLARGTSVTVRPGDSLWSIAERLVAPAASTSEIAEIVGDLYDLNRAQIGSDPDLILPGHQLRTPLGRRPAR